MAGASAQHAAGYRPMMLFFTISSTLGALFALVLWLRTRGKETPAASSPAGAGG
jgi:hypothetical protein